MKIRVVKTASNAHAVQVVRYQNNKREILKHVGSATTEIELRELKILAQDWIRDFSVQLSIFPQDYANQTLHLSHCVFIGVKYRFFYTQIISILDSVGLTELLAFSKTWWS